MGGMHAVVAQQGGWLHSRQCRPSLPTPPLWRWVGNGNVPACCGWTAVVAQHAGQVCIGGASGLNVSVELTARPPGHFMQPATHEPQAPFLRPGSCIHYPSAAATFRCCNPCCAAPQALLEAGGANPNLANCDLFIQRPATHFPWCPQALLEAGANPNLADGTGTTAVQAAEQAGNPDIIQLLSGYGAAAPAAEAAGAPAAEA